MLIARLEVLGDVDARGAVRFHVAGESTIRGLGDKPFDVLIDNFSRTGFLFVSDTEFPVGTLVAVGLSGAGSHEAKVVWRDANRHGCEFLVPLPQSKMERAFTGQASVVAALEAALERRYREASEAEAAVVQPAPSPREGFWARLAKRFRR